MVNSQIQASNCSLNWCLMNDYYGCILRQWLVDEAAGVKSGQCNISPQMSLSILRFLGRVLPDSALITSYAVA